MLEHLGGAGADTWGGSLLSTVGIYPVYSYSRGRNILRVKIPVSSINYVFLLFFAADKIGFLDKSKLAKES